MPGSRVKKWRAFLSAAHGPDGNQVNAIERIGNGPWYDRLGRLLSPDIAGLLTSRPNGDASIKNDLPNENGVPNHSPDGKQVDNHMTITGSGADGKLYQGRDNTDCTCSDWTSTTVSSKPRVGLSWPRGTFAGMQNWISQMDAWGCEAGIDLTEASMAGAGKPGDVIIGSGGGYGGFYCFALTP